MIAFRPIGDEDVEAVVALWRQCALVKPQNDPYKDISFARGKDSSEVLIGEENGSVVTTVMLGHDGHRGMIYYLAVTPGRQGEGLGKATVREAESWLKARGIWKINLLVRSENEKVRRFYETLGYEINEVFCMGRRIVT